MGFPHSSIGKASICNVGDPGLIPGSGRSPGEGTGYPLQYSWASLVAQLVKNPPAMWETWVWSLGWEDPLEKGKATHSSIRAWRIPGTVQSVGSQRVGCDFHFHKRNNYILQRTSPLDHFLSCRKTHRRNFFTWNPRKGWIVSWTFNVTKIASGLAFYAMPPRKLRAKYIEYVWSHGVHFCQFSTWFCYSVISPVGFDLPNFVFSNWVLCSLVSLLKSLWRW